MITKSDWFELFFLHEICYKPIAIIQDDSVARGPKLLSIKIMLLR
jgi:hypothetical protein